MTKVVEVLLSQSVAWGTGQLLSHVWVVNDLQSFPVALRLQNVVHLLLSTAIAVLHDPSVILDQPDFLQKDLDVTWWVVLDHIRNVLDWNTFSTTTVTFRFLERNNWVDEWSEVFTNWQINKNILKECNHIVISTEQLYGSKLLEVELSQWVQWWFCDCWVLVVLGSHNNRNNVFDLILVHHFVKETWEWGRSLCL